jgi:endonuclease/exonuclease/phosphatase family metal-dependent hydrolase
MGLETGWLEGLRRYQTLVELKGSSFYSDYGDRIETFLKTVQLKSKPDAAPRLNSFLRIAQWNIEKGKRFDSILNLLQSNEILRWADVIILNEADHGMNRSQNRHVARDLAENLGMHMAFAPCFIELTKGTGDELDLDGQNRESLQGNAVLSRYPIQEAQVFPLPTTFEPYEFSEKRFGWRNCLWVGVRLTHGVLWVGSVHLELRNTPKCRARQMQYLLERLPGEGEDSYVLGGDLNTNGFGRGTALRTLKSVSRILCKAPSELKRELLHPELGSERLFRNLSHFGFSWENLNSSQETARTEIDSLEEVEFFPDKLLNVIHRRLEPYHGYLGFKLDWLLGKNVRSLVAGQNRDSRTDVVSLNPACVKMENSGPNRISDHLPIYADFEFA